MTELVEKQSFNRGWRSYQLPGYLAGDVSAAFLSATLISPILTAIDRAVVENVSSTTRPLSIALKENILCTYRHPKRFFAAKPFFYMWTLYAVTYTTANSVNTLTTTFMDKSHEILAKSITFVVTCTVNVPLGVWKDIRFVQTFGGRPTPPPKGPVNTSPNSIKTSPPPQNPTKFPISVAATFLARDALTILGSFTLPPMLSHRIPIADPAAQMAAAQLLVPVLSQVVATPVHLLGLDLYSNPEKGERGQRVGRIRRGLLGTTAVRCARIVPAFGVGGIVNTGLREWFRGRVDGYGFPRRSDYNVHTD
ncbi:uncharacterized protein CC84DRAFT_1202024 [Paraphaeosphaeria sporulosa]|uniref:Sequence orphan n=1 Tax=Paraphaeosphaeria sporulosa TaxID=1460663 RepID=A0A177CNW5_9PLEO|nr:uncharacterized protein CC84DRAFT_1202024 [Paraphaeosphaeria sporulosa]OAG09225.1 hypothetical protein CC84DRAFT_1202024 [Paraphaeosphaeria sporulosa]